MLAVIPLLVLLLLSFLSAVRPFLRSLSSLRRCLTAADTTERFYMIISRPSSGFLAHHSTFTPRPPGLNAPPPPLPLLKVSPLWQNFSSSRPLPRSFYLSLPPRPTALPSPRAKLARKITVGATAVDLGVLGLWQEILLWYRLSLDVQSKDAVGEGVRWVHRLWSVARSAGAQSSFSCSSTTDNRPRSQRRGRRVSC